MSEASGDRTPALPEISRTEFSQESPRASSPPFPVQAPENQPQVSATKHDYNTECPSDQTEADAVPTVQDTQQGTQINGRESPLTPTPDSDPSPESSTPAPTTPPSGNIRVPLSTSAYQPTTTTTTGAPAPADGANKNDPLVIEDSDGDSDIIVVKQTSASPKRQFRGVSIAGGGTGKSIGLTAGAATVAIKSQQGSFGAQLAVSAAEYSTYAAAAAQYNPQLMAQYQYTQGYLPGALYTGEYHGQGTGSLQGGHQPPRSSTVSASPQTPRPKRAAAEAGAQRLSEALTRVSFDGSGDEGEDGEEASDSEDGAWEDRGDREGEEGEEGMQRTVGPREVGGLLKEVGTVTVKPVGSTLLSAATAAAPDIPQRKRKAPSDDSVSSGSLSTGLPQTSASVQQPNMTSATALNTQYDLRFNPLGYYAAAQGVMPFLTGQAQAGSNSSGTGLPSNTNSMTSGSTYAATTSPFNSMGMNLGKPGQLPGQDYPFMAFNNPYLYPFTNTAGGNNMPNPYQIPNAASQPAQEAPRQRKRRKGNTEPTPEPQPAPKTKKRPPTLPSSLLKAGATGHYPHFTPSTRGLAGNPSFPPLTADGILASVAPSSATAGLPGGRASSGPSESKFRRREIAELLAFLTQTICWKDVASAVGGKRRTANSFASHWRNVLVRNVVERYPE